MTVSQTNPRHPAHRRLEVALGERSYPILIGEGLLSDASLWQQCLGDGQVVIITNDVVGPLYGRAVEALLRPLCRQLVVVELPDGEAQKDIGSLMKIFDAMLEARLERSATVVALGGGVIGDMAGFAAACYQRGVDFVQVPTTLLSQVDSSVGGKTAINHPLGKNMIGAFYQPRAVLIDMAVLRTLPAKELAAGLAEVIKYGCILDARFFDWLEANMDRLLDRDPEALAYAIERSCQLKALVVAEDERESRGRRALLNFGHTFGHAIEAGLGFGVWLHGEAVGCGMVMAAWLSRVLGQLTQEEVDRLTALIRRVGLPTVGPAWPSEQYLEWMRHDKKADAGQIRYILLRGIGESEQRPVSDDAVSRALTMAQGAAA